jgi:hypothetical protein
LTAAVINALRESSRHGRSGRLFSTGQNNIIPGSSKGSTNCNGRYSCVSPVLAEAMNLVSTRTNALFGLLENGGAPQ